MGINLEYYRTFYYVAKYGKISVVAEKLYVSQPAITQTIKKMEEQLNLTLFYRNRDGVTLTEEGKNLYDYIRDSISILENAEQRSKQFANLEVGSIKIRTGDTVAKDLLYEPLTEFIKKYPNIKIEISNGKPQESIEWLNQGDLDLVLLNLPFETKYTNITIEKILEKEYVFVMTPEYKKENNVKIEKEQDLEKYNLILPKKESTSRNVLNSMIKSAQDLQSNYDISSEMLKVSLAKNSCGITFVDKKLVKSDIKTGKLIEIKFPNRTFITSEGLAMLKPEIASFATKELVNYIRKVTSIEKTLET